MNKKTNNGLKIISLNRKASFNYFFKELFEAGITSGFVQLTATYQAGGDNSAGFTFRTRNGSSGTGERIRIGADGTIEVQDSVTLSTIIYAVFGNSKSIIGKEDKSFCEFNSTPSVKGTTSKNISPFSFVEALIEGFSRRFRFDDDFLFLNL